MGSCFFLGKAATLAAAVPACHIPRSRRRNGSNALLPTPFVGYPLKRGPSTIGSRDRHSADSGPIGHSGGETGEGSAWITRASHPPQRSTSRPIRRALPEQSRHVLKGRADVERVRRRKLSGRLLRAIVVLALIDFWMVNRSVARQGRRCRTFRTSTPWSSSRCSSSFRSGPELGDVLPLLVRQVAGPARPSRGDRGRPRRGRRARQPGGRGQPDAGRVPGLQDVPRAHGRQPPARRAVRRPSGDRQDLPREGDGQAGRRARSCSPPPRSSRTCTSA